MTNDDLSSRPRNLRNETPDHSADRYGGGLTPATAIESHPEWATSVRHLQYEHPWIKYPKPS
jgi:hypothetical protein